MEPLEKYTNYEDLSTTLPNIKEITILLFSNNWEDNFESLTRLRTFNKHNWNELKYYWIYLKPRIIELCSSLRSSLSKNALIFVSETLNAKKELFEVKDLLKMLLSKLAIEKSFIKSEVMNGISKICTNYSSLDNCEIILDYTFSKSVNIAKMALKYLENMLSKLSPENNYKVLLRIEKGKRQEHSNLAKKILAELNDEWPEYKNFLDLEENKLKNWVFGLNKQKPLQTISLKDVIKSKKDEKVEIVENIKN